MGDCPANPANLRKGDLLRKRCWVEAVPETTFPSALEELPLAMLELAISEADLVEAEERPAGLEAVPQA